MDFNVGQQRLIYLQCLCVMGTVIVQMEVMKHIMLVAQVSHYCYRLVPKR